MRSYLILSLSGLFFSTTLMAEVVDIPANHMVTDQPNSKRLKLEGVTDDTITDRPSAKHPELPEFLPEKLPDFKLPPVDEKIIPKDQTDSVKIHLKSVEFSGNTVISTEQLQEIAQPFIGKTVSVTELEELRQKLTQYYNEQGYVNSGAALPEQNIQNGKVRFDIIEGKLKEVWVSGTEWLSPDYVKDRLEMNNDEPLNVNELRGRFQQLLLDPLIERMNGSLIPGTQRGESILDVDVARARPYQLMLSTDNYRPPSIGSIQTKLSGWVRNLTGLGDIVDATFLFSQGLHDTRLSSNVGSIGGSGGWSIPLNAYDTRFNFHFDINNSKVIEKPMNTLDIKSEYLAFDFGLIQPLIQTLNTGLNLGVSFNVKENKTFLLDRPFSFSEGAVKGVSRDSVLRFSLDFNKRFEHHVIAMRSTTSVGIRAFDATWHNQKQYSIRIPRYDHKNKRLSFRTYEFTRDIPDGDFVSWLGQFQYAGQLFGADNGTLILRADGQYTDDKLMPMERFSLGGRYSVRGYRENEIIRDRGYIISAEYRYPLLENSSEFPGQLTVFPFMDYGAAWNRSDRKHTTYLHSVGLGFEWRPIKNVISEIMYAHALNKPADKTEYDLQDSGVHLRVSYSAF